MPKATIVLRTFSDEWEAMLARDFLETAGIHAVVDTGGRDFLPSLMGGPDVHQVRLLVLQRDAGRAEEALQALDQTTDPSESA